MFMKKLEMNFCRACLMEIILQQRQPLFTGVLDPGSHFGYYPVHFVALCSTVIQELAASATPGSPCFPKINYTLRAVSEGS